MLKICVAGEGAFGTKHLEGLQKIKGVQVTALVGGVKDAADAVAAKFNIPFVTMDLAEALARADAAILATPTQIHARQA